MIEYEMRGADQFVAAIRALGKGIPRDELEADAVEVCEPVAAAMAAGAPKHTGRYARGFRAQAVRPAQPQQVRILIGPTGGQRSRGYLGFFLERGTWRLPARPHIRPAWDARVAGLRAALRAKVRARWASLGRQLGFRVQEAA